MYSNLNFMSDVYTVYPKKYAHGFCFAVLCCGYTLTDFPISIRLTSLALWQSNDCPSASKATLMNMDKYFMWIHYERLHNHNKAKHNKTVCIFLGIYCKFVETWRYTQSQNVNYVNYYLKHAIYKFVIWFWHIIVQIFGMQIVQQLIGTYTNKPAIMKLVWQMLWLCTHLLLGNL